MNLEDAASFFKEHWGITARATKLNGERDLNFRLTTDTDEEFILKIYPSPTPETERLLAIQDRALTHLANLGRTPQLLRSEEHTSEL